MIGILVLGVLACLSDEWVVVLVVRLNILVFTRWLSAVPSTSQALCSSSVTVWYRLHTPSGTALCSSVHWCTSLQCATICSTQACTIVKCCLHSLSARCDVINVIPLQCYVQAVYMINALHYPLSALKWEIFLCILKLYIYHCMQHHSIMLFNSGAAAVFCRNCNLFKTANLCNVEEHSVFRTTLTSNVIRNNGEKIVFLI